MRLGIYQLYHAPRKDKDMNDEKSTDDKAPVQASNEKMKGFVLFALVHDKTEKLVEVYEPQTNTMIKVPIYKIPILIDLLQDFTKNLQNPDQTESTGEIISPDPSSEICMTENKT